MTADDDGSEKKMFENINTGDVIKKKPEFCISIKTKMHLSVHSNFNGGDGGTRTRA